jgi:predicted unusual protein kinase regulating ubiquinone biosynthesis (AarF/ABC1/UbiB family)
MTTSRARRNAQVAAVGARVGVATVASRARQVFADAERKEELRSDLQFRTAAEVAATLGSMKGALMKLGQMASFVDEGLPEPLRQALSQLQADAPPMSPQLAAEVIERELGSHPDVLFEEWDEVPIAAASIGQVHRAITRDGRAVAVKVQYPGIAEAITSDLGNADLLFGAISMAFPAFDRGPLVEELRTRLAEELDYEREARNQEQFARFFEGHPFLHVPAVHADLSSARVLTTELATGARFSEVETWDQEQRDLAGEALFRFVFRSLYRFRAFNADPHPGNYLFRPDGRVTFLDFGLVRHFDEHEVSTFESLIRHMVIEHDPEAFRRAVEHAGLLTPQAPVTTEEVTDYFGHFYRWIREGGVLTWSGELASSNVRQVFNAAHPVTKHTTVPPSFVFIQRINLGLYGILGRLRATANWRDIAEELWPMTDAPPSTALGRAEAAWWRSVQARGLVP